MSIETEEPVLPYTPTQTARRARVGYLGFNGVGFNDLWPLFTGLIVSITLALKFFVAASGGRGHWLSRTLLAAAPLAAGFGYLRLLVVGRPPHFKGDLWQTVLGLRLDFTDPPLRRFPLVPRMVVDATAATGPHRAADRPHPLPGKLSRGLS